MKLFFVWIGYLNSIGYGLNDAVWINIDESPIPYHVSGKKGLRLHPLSKKDDHEMRDRTSLAQIRSRCTLIASIASDNTLQQHLPQVLMPNERGLKKKWQLASESATEYPCIQVLKGTQGWINTKSFKKYLHILHNIVKAKAAGKKIVLMMDCLASHISVEILRVIRKFKWRLMLIPSKLTYMLQPLDAYVFARLKHRLHHDHSYTRINISDGHPGFLDWAKTSMSTINSMFETLEAQLFFQKCGCSIPKSVLSEPIWRFVQHANMGHHRKLTKDELSFFMGRASAMQWHLVFRDPIPENFRDRPIVIRSPTHRLSSKRSFQSLL